MIASWAALPGQLFLALLQMIVVPLVFASIIRGLAASEDMDQLRRTGSRLLVYFLGTSSIAISIGIAFAWIIGPGRLVDAAQMPQSGAAVPTVGGYLPQPSACAAKVSATSAG